jgi:hypothetical protein
MQVDELLKSLEGMGDILAGFQNQLNELTPLMDETNEGMEGIDPSLKAKLTEISDKTMKDLSVQKTELEALKKSVNDIKL